MANKKKITKKKSLKKSVKSKATKSKTKKKVATKKKVSKKPATKTVKKPSTKANKVSQAKPSPWLGKKLPEIKNLQVQSAEGTTTTNLQDLTSNGICVLYFYPKDDTPGCTTEACDFSNSIESFKAIGAKVIGVSPDNTHSHAKFIKKYNLPFPLIADTDKILCQKMMVWKEKSFMGKKYMGVERSTFLLKDGFVVQVWQPVKVEGHVADVQQKITSLKG